LAETVPLTRVFYLLVEHVNITGKKVKFTKDK
jgi:hypothetical protein